MRVIQKAFATIEDSDTTDHPHGGFTAVLSTPSTDRDGDNLEQAGWKSLPDRIPIDVDHGMSVASTVGSGAPYWDDTTGKMMIDVAFSSIPRAQETRSLVKEGHINGISVAFMVDKTVKDGAPARELLNAGIVAIPSNRDAVILEAKSFEPTDEYVERNAVIVGKAVNGSLEDLRCRIASAVDAIAPAETYPWVRATFLNDDGTSGTVVYEQGNDTIARDFEDDGASVSLSAEARAVELITVMQPKSFAGEVVTKAGSPAEASLIQGIHDASCHLGAQCAGQEPLSPDGMQGDPQAQPQNQQSRDDGQQQKKPPAKSKSAMVAEITLKPKLDMADFEAQLASITKSSDAKSDSPQDDESAPAEAASEAASDKDPAEEPADAADDNSDEVAEKQAAILASLLETDMRIRGLDS